MLFVGKTASFPQVIDDLKGECVEAVEAGDREKILEIREEWPKRAAALMTHGEDKSITVAPQKKRFRVDASQYMAALDNYIQEVTDVGLAHFAQPANIEERASPWTWPHLVISPDQGADGVCGINWFIHAKHGNCDTCWDQSHGLWNDWKRALKTSGMWYKKQIMVVLWNIRHGPYNASMWEKKLRGSMDEYFAVADHRNCPIWQWVLPRLLNDRGISHRITEENISAEMWEVVRASRKNVTKGTKVNMTRWFAAVHRSKEFDPMWHEELLNFIMLCLTTGIITTGSFAYDLAGKLTKDIQDEGEAKHEGGMKAAGSQTLTRLRACTKNTYHLGLYILMDPENQRQERIQTILTEPLWAWHGEQSKKLRNCDDTLEWTRCEVGGKCMAPLNAVLAALADPGALEYCGFSSSLTPAEAQLGLDDHVFQTEMRMAHTMGNFAMNLCAARIRRNCWFWFGWPSKLCLFTHPEEATRNAALADFLTKTEIFAEIKGRPEAFWKKAVERSPFSTVSVQQIEACLKLEGNQLTEMMVEWARKRGQVVSVSTASEHCFKVLRRHEEKGTNGSFSSKTAWGVLVEKQVLHTDHNYKEVAHRDELIQRGDKPYLTESTFHHRVVKRSMNFSELVGYKDRPEWFTNNSETNMLPHCDFIIAEECMRRKDWKAASRTWLSCLAVSSTLLLRQWAPAGKEGAFFFSLGQSFGGCVVAWPAMEVEGPGKAVGYVPKPLQSPGDVKFIVVVDPAEWEAMAFKWTPPAVQLKERKVVLNGGIVAVAMAKPEPLLRCAARACFWDLKKTVLTRLATHYGVLEDTKNASLFDLLRALVSRFAALPLSQVFEILTLRLQGKYDAYEDLFKEEDCVDLVEEEDQQELMDTIANTRHAAEEGKGFKKELRKAMRKHRASSLKGKGLDPNRGKKFPTKFPTGDLTLDDAKAMAPLGTLGIKLDCYSGRWWAQYSTRECKSRSWQVYGFNQSCRLILQWLWAEYLDEHDLPVESCPIEGLLEPVSRKPAEKKKVAASAAKASSSSSSKRVKR